MTSVRKATLQENVFGPKGERLIHVLPILVPEENEDYVLCLTVTRDKEVHITFLKILSHGLKETFVTQEVWYLDDLTLVDGKDATSDNPHLDLHFQAVYSWEASSTAAKYAFVRSLRKMNKVYLQKDIQFLNFDDDYIKEMSFFGVPEDTMLRILENPLWEDLHAAKWMVSEKKIAITHTAALQHKPDNLGLTEMLVA